MKFFSNKKILICSYYFPPTKTVASVRIFNLYIESKKHFKEVFGMTTSNRQLFPKDHFSLNDENVSEVWTYDLRTFLGNKKGASPTINQSKKESAWGKFMIKLAYSFPFNLILADGGMSYILGGFFKGKKMIQKNKIDIIFSTFKPYSNHLICYFLKKWNPQLVWIADFRDLHIDEIRDNVYFPKLQYWFNRHVLKNADMITTVSDGLTKNLLAYHDKVYVLKNAISSLNEQLVSNDFFSKFSISYTGSIYGNLRSARLLFKGLKNLIHQGKIDQEKIQVNYAGSDQTVWQKWVEEFELQSINVFHGNVSMEKAKEIQQRSQINLLLSWASETQQGVLTAKFYEYLAAQNPILLIIKGSKDLEFEKIFTELEAGKVVYDDDIFQKDLEKFILKYYHEWLASGTITRSIQWEELQKFRWDDQMKNFLNYLEKQM